VTLERIARADASVAMVVLMHYAAVSVVESHGPDDVRRAAPPVST
jgi:isovaleryl-CoA dehydrogenase